MTVKGGTTPACAACKYQRRKCSPSCPLAPYFPSNKPKMFQNVHRLFGVSNVTKTLRSLKTRDQKDDAMKSIIYEANMRERYPVYGCSQVICHLRFQLEHNFEELRRVHLQLASCREQQHQQSADCGWPVAQFEFGSPSSVMTQIDHFGSSSSNDPLLQAYQYGQLNGNVSEMVNQYHVWNDNTQFYAQSSSSDDTAKPRPLLNLDARSATTTTSKNSLEEAATRTQVIQEQMDAFSINDRNIYYGQDFEEMVDNSMDHRDAFDSSSESMDHTCGRELKNAAAAFSLTTVN